MVWNGSKTTSSLSDALSVNELPLNYKKETNVSSAM